jgi:hypothetical protein
MAREAVLGPAEVGANVTVTVRGVVVIVAVVGDTVNCEASGPPAVMLVMERVPVPVFEIVNVLKDVAPWTVLSIVSEVADRLIAGLPPVPDRGRLKTETPPLRMVSRSKKSPNEGGVNRTTTLVSRLGARVMDEVTDRAGRENAVVCVSMLSTRKFTALEFVIFTVSCLKLPTATLPKAMEVLETVWAAAKGTPTPRDTPAVTAREKNSLLNMAPISLLRRR